jgi:hypothetical protein
VARPLLLSLALITLAAGCAAGPQARGAIADRRWVAVDAPHVTLYTDLGGNRGEAIARDIEARWAVMTDIYAGMLMPHKARPTIRLTVVHLAECDELEAIVGDQAGVASTVPDVLRQRIAVTCEKPDPATTRQVTSHEIAHLLNFHYFNRLPIWLEEGLATYFQTLSLGATEVVLGEYPLYHHRRAVFLPTLGALLSMTQEAFYALPGAYIVAWRLVHLLATDNDGDNARFQDLLRALGNGTPAAAAWASAFGGAEERIQVAYREYMSRSHLQTWVMPYAPPAPPPLRRRALTRGDVHDVWMQVVATFGAPKSRRARARAYLRSAAADAAIWPAADYWSAMLDLHDGALYRTTIDRFRRYASRAPDDPRGATAVLIAAVGAVADDGLSPSAPPGLDALRPEMAAVQRHPRSAAALHAMAWYFAIARKSATGEGLARRALALEPACAGCEDTLALLLYQRGAFADAVEHQERAIHLMGESPPPRDWLDRLAHYRARLSAP